MDKVSLFIFNIFINSFLVFFTAFLLVEGVIWLFRVKRGRAASLLRMTPFGKLVLDLFRYDFGKWAYLSGIDPLQCEEGSRNIMLGVKVESLSQISSSLEMTIPGGKTFTVADILSTKIPSNLLFIFALLLCFVSCVFLCRWVSRLFGKRPSYEGEILSIKNPVLASYCQKHRVQVILTKELKGSPCIVGLRSPVIYIPASYGFSLKECEAIVAHELEHFRYKDTFIRSALQCIQAVFFWTPTSYLYKKIEDGQEVSCDLRAIKRGVDPVDMASAIYSSAKGFYQNKQPLVSYFRRYALYQRVHLLLHPKGNKKVQLVLSLLAVGLAFIVILLGRFWIF